MIRGLFALHTCGPKSLCILLSQRGNVSTSFEVGQWRDGFVSASQFCRCETLPDVELL